MAERTYSKIEEAEQIVKSLYEKYPDELWMVNPKIVVVLGVENKIRGKKSKTLARVRSVRNAIKAVFQIYNVDIRYIIEIYWSDWNQWNNKLKQWVIFHELQHISAEIGKIVRHDCEDFAMIVDIVGPTWASEPDKLPDLLGEKVKFNLDLRPNLVEYCEENNISKEDKDEDDEG